MRKFRLVARILTLVLAVVVTVSADVSPQQKYIDTWAGTAVREMYRSGVPASITLAQGLLESRYGQSTLASKGNNHFGIKCHNDWKGKTMKVDDDAPKECFRVYDTADESFRDHSDFLRYWDRYKFLFEYDVTDYESWARGLKKAGYATDPNYAKKLISLIEDYGLSKYDRMKPGDFKDSAGDEEISGKDKKAKKEKVSKDKPDSKDKSATKDKQTKKEKAPKEKKRKSEPVEEIPTEIPESPLTIEEAHPLKGEAAEQFSFSLTRQMLSKNGVPFIYALEGETFASIASANNLFLKELLKYNDASAGLALHAGDIVYLQAKKTQTRRGLDKYIVEQDGESLRDICQRFAVKQKSIEKLNSFERGHQLREGDTVLLRK